MDYEVLSFNEKGEAKFQENHVFYNKEKNLFGLADGFGGKGVGDSAAKSSCDLIHEFMTTQSEDRDATLPFIFRKYYSLNSNLLLNAVSFANQKLYRDNQKKNIFGRGGCSVIAASLKNKFLSLVQFGSTRADLIREGIHYPLLRPFVYSGSESKDHEAGIPLAALGLYRDVEGNVQELQIKQGDWVCLSSYGASEADISSLTELNKKNLDLSSLSGLLSKIYKSNKFKLNNSSVILCFK